MSAVWDASHISSLKLGTYPRSQVHEASASLRIFFSPRQTSVRALLDPLAGVSVRGPRSSGQGAAPGCHGDVFLRASRL